MPGYLYRTGAPFDVQLVIFGKDGTLLDSEAVRLPALKECTTAIAHTAGEPALLPALLKAGGWEDTDKGPTLAPDSVMACGTTLELAQRWIDTQPMVAAHWHEDAVALCAEMQEVKMRAPRLGPRGIRAEPYAFKHSVPQTGLRAPWRTAQLCLSPNERAPRLI